MSNAPVMTSVVVSFALKHCPIERESKGQWLGLAAGGLCSRNTNDEPKCYDADGAPAPVAGTVSKSSHTSTKTSTRTTATSASFPTTASSSLTPDTTSGSGSMTITGPFVGDDTPTSSTLRNTVTGTTSIATATGGGGANIPGLTPNGATMMAGPASAAVLFAYVMTTLLIH
ncbi:hypothetical protein H2248_002037 [Termitomyces sp. 'cryptogamus']|nr:hypothetical protein H2248_002037 [Termitomyces sp. 'cryptogamus']